MQHAMFTRHVFLKTSTAASPSLAWGFPLSSVKPIVSIVKIEDDKIDMDLIIEGTNPLATDMVAAKLTRIETYQVPIFVWVIKSGMHPTDLAEIEIHDENIAKVKRHFGKPTLLL